MPTLAPEDEPAVLEAYAKHMSTPGRVITALELGILSAVAKRDICVLSVYKLGRKVFVARGGDSQSGPISHGPFKATAPIILWRWQDHFDLLLPCEGDPSSL